MLVKELKCALWADPVRELAGLDNGRGQGNAPGAFARHGRVLPSRRPVLTTTTDGLAMEVRDGESQHFGSTLFQRVEYAMHELQRVHERHPDIGLEPEPQPFVDEEGPTPIRVCCVAMLAQGLDCILFAYTIVGVVTTSDRNNGCCWCSRGWSGHGGRRLHRLGHLVARRRLGA